MNTQTDIRCMMISVKKYLFLTLSLLLLTFCLKAQNQNNSINKELQFINYLVANEQYNEAIFLIEKHAQSSAFSTKTDSLIFLKGKTLYKQQKLIESAQAFTKLPVTFPNYKGIKTLQAYEYVHIGKYNKGLLILDSLKTENNLINELLKLQKASIHLLNKDMVKYDAYMVVQDTSFNQLIEAQTKLNDYAYRIKNHKKKSPFVAGLMSALIPGTGKMYTGKIGEGVSTFLGMSILGLITYENYSKQGINNYKTILFGSLTGVLYAGNIFGSVYSVKAHRNEFNESVNHAIIFNMHIPIRTVFPQLF